MPAIPLATRPGEYTKVGLETEVKIPFLTFLFMCFVLVVIDTSAWGIFWLIWNGVAKRAGSFWRWFARAGWRWYTGTLIVCIVLSAVTYLYRLVVEQLAKNTPSYDNLDPREGIWNPLPRRYIESDDEPEEMEHETMDVNLWDRIKGGKRKRRRTLPDFLMTEDAKQFYRAVAGNARLFSQRRATDFGISRTDFNKHIRDPLLAREMAEWKNKRHKKQGVRLLPDALRTLEVLGRQ